MKIRLKKEDKLSIIRGLKSNVYNLNELNHLSKDICDHSGDVELFEEVLLPLEPEDRRQLLAALQSGYIDFERMPDLKEKVKNNFFLSGMKEAFQIENHE